MMDYQYILFDLDGTLTESGPGIINSVSYALGKLGLSVDNKEELKKFIGPPLTDSLMEFYGLSEEAAEQGVAYYREYYTDKGIFENSVYNDIPETLERLQSAGKILAVATSKPEIFAKKIAAYFSIDKYFAFICGATMDDSRVGKADVIRYTLESLNIDKMDYKKVLMVGDRKHDILGAKENGIASMGVLYGYGERKELEMAGADYIVSLPSDIAEHIAG